MVAVLSVSGESMHFMIRAMFLLMFRGFPEVAKVVGEAPDGFPLEPTAKPGKLLIPARKNIKRKIKPENESGSEPEMFCAIWTTLPRPRVNLGRQYSPQHF